LHEALEFALFWAIPRRDTHSLAHRLINEFGSVAAVFDAPIRLLTEVDGIGESTAIFLKLIPQLARIYQEDKFSFKKKIPTLEECCHKLVLKFIGRTEEAVAVMLFDSKGKTVYDGIVNKGTVNAVDIYSRKIIELITAYFATSVLIAHNHPSGIAIPSYDDIASTDTLGIIMRGMNVIFLDHIIVADDDYVSMRQCKISQIFEDKET